MTSFLRDEFIRSFKYDRWKLFTTITSTKIQSSAWWTVFTDHTFARQKVKKYKHKNELYDTSVNQTKPVFL